MTQKITPDEQVNFLISCIRHTDHGKIDFQQVANECNIVSKPAAAKRYERLLKAHNIPTSKPTSSPAHASILNANVSSAKSTPTKTPKATPNKANPKTKATAGTKRKISSLEDSEMAGGDGDDDEGLLPKVKREKGDKEEDVEKDGVVKEEVNGYYIIHHPKEDVGGGGFGGDGAMEMKEESKEDLKGFLGSLRGHGMGMGVVKEEEIKKEINEEGILAVEYPGMDGMAGGVDNSIVIAD